jgi:hypothetical protein
MWPIGVCAAVAGCSSILGIPSGSLSFCAQPENQGHDYCEDYDVGDALGRIPQMNRADQGTSSMKIGPSDDSPPNLIDFVAHGSDPDAGGHSVAGYFTTFAKKFSGLRVDADVKIVTQNGTLGGIGGFLLVGSSPGACLGFAVVPGPFVALPPDKAVFTAVYVGQGAGGCGSLVALGNGGIPLGIVGMGDAGAGMPDGGAPPPAVLVPALDQWFHLTVQVEPATDGSGGGTLLLRAGLSSQQLEMPAGTVPSDGQPIVGFAAAPSTPFVDEMKFDNVTVDVAAQQLSP